MNSDKQLALGHTMPGPSEYLIQQYNNFYGNLEPPQNMDEIAALNYLTLLTSLNGAVQYLNFLESPHSAHVTKNNCRFDVSWLNPTVIDNNINLINKAAIVNLQILSKLSEKQIDTLEDYAFVSAYINKIIELNDRYPGKYRNLLNTTKNLLRQLVGVASTMLQQGREVSDPRLQTVLKTIQNIVDNQYQRTPLPKCVLHLSAELKQRSDTPEFFNVNRNDIAYQALILSMGHSGDLHTNTTGEEIVIAESVQRALNNPEIFDPRTVPLDISQIIYMLTDNQSIKNNIANFILQKTNKNIDDMDLITTHISHYAKEMDFDTRVQYLEQISRSFLTQPNIISEEILYDNLRNLWQGLSKKELINSIEVILENIARDANDGKIKIGPTYLSKLLNIINIFEVNQNTVSEKSVSLQAELMTYCDSRITFSNIMVDGLSPTSLLQANSDQVSVETMQSLYAVLQEAMPPIAFNHDLSNFPPGILMLVSIMEEQDVPALVETLNAYKKGFLNKAGLRQYNVSEFLTISHLHLMNLYHCFGKDTFEIMKGLLKSTTIPLTRFLANYNDMPLSAADTLKAMTSKFVPGSEEQRQFIQSCSIFWDLYSRTRRGDPQQIAEEFNQSLAAYREATGQQLIEILHRSILDVYFLSSRLSRHEQLYTEFLKKIPSAYRTDYLQGLLTIQPSAFSPIYNRMIENDLSGHPDYDNLTHNQEHHIPEMKALADHNAHIHSELTNHGINGELALRYDRTTQFSSEKYAAVKNAKQQLLDINDNFMYLKNVLKSAASDERFQEIAPLIKKLNAEINTIHNQLTKGKNSERAGERIKRIHNNLQSFKNLQPLLKQLNDELTKRPELINLLSSQDAVAQQNFQQQNVLQAVKVLDEKITTYVPKIQTDILTNPTIDPTKEEYSVKQWDKSDPATFILGEQLSCCLAPTGTDFPAIVQRRQDDAIQIHVVLDNTTGEPIAGSWLFFAQDKNDPSKVYLCANFFEIRAGIGMNPEKRDQIIQKLSEYSAQYAQEVGAQEFLIRRLKYGLVPDFKDLEEVKIQVQKVGSNLCLDPTQPDQYTYFLEAENKKTFHRHPLPAPEINNEITQTVTPADEEPSYTSSRSFSA